MNIPDMDGKTRSKYIDAGLYSMIRREYFPSALRPVTAMVKYLMIFYLTSGHTRIG